MSFNCSIFNIYSYLQFILNISSGVDWDSGIPIDIRTFIISYIHLKIFMEIKLIKLNFFFICGTKHDLAGFPTEILSKTSAELNQYFGVEM